MNIPEIEWAENVILIDTHFLNTLIGDIKRFYEEKLKRQLSKIYLNELMDFFMLDMEIKPGNNECMVIWIYDSESTEIKESIPCNIPKELNGMGFDDKIGSFYMFGAPTGKLISRKDLFMNIMDLIIDSKKVKRIGIIPEGKKYEEDAICKLDTKIEEKIATAFLLSAASIKNNNNINFKSIFYPVMQALGIKGEEI